MRVNYIKCGDCMELMKELPSNSIDLILTSPFYATNKKAGKHSTLKNTKVKEGQYDYVRYDVFVDSMNTEEYCEFSVNLFNSFDKILKNDGCVLYNLSYSSENASCMFEAIHSIISETNFDIVDVICWKKKSVLPNVCSPNRLTRICEYVFVFARKQEIKTFKCNKECVSERSNGQKMYNSFPNFIEAKNNDGSCPLNKATYSSELCEKLLQMYAPISWGKDCVVLDPFNGTGTTGVACKRLGISYIGFELSKEQCKWSVKRIKETKGE